MTRAPCSIAPASVTSPSRSTTPNVATTASTWPRCASLMARASCFSATRGALRRLQPGVDRRADDAAQRLDEFGWRVLLAAVQLHERRERHLHPAHVFAARLAELQLVVEHGAEMLVADPRRPGIEVRIGQRPLPRQGGADPAAE